VNPFYTSVCTKGNRILHRGYGKDGHRIHESLTYRPTLFVTTGKPKPSSWRTIDGRAVDPVDFDTMYEARQFSSEYRGVGGLGVYGDIDSEFQFIADRYGSEGEMPYDPSVIRVLSLDIEVESEDGFPSVDDPRERVNAITLIQGSKVHALGLGDFSVDGVTCHSFNDEASLLHRFLDLWEELDPDIITGWNAQFYDIPYLYNRISRVLGSKAVKRLSPWGEIRTRKVVVMDRENQVYDLAGISILDYYDLYRKFTFVTRESYKLQHIAMIELGEGKIDYSDVGTLSDLYKQDFQRFMEYNIKDTRLVIQLEDKLRLIELAQALAYSARTNLDDVFSQVRMWDSIIYHYLRTKRIAIPPKPSVEKREQFAGAYVKEPKPNTYEWVASFDLDSLYPHLIMQYNLSPETLVEERIPDMTADTLLAEPERFTGALARAHGENLSVAGNGTMYRRDIHGFLPELMETMYKQRKEYKRLSVDAKGWLKKNADTASPQQVLEKKKEVSKYHNFQLVRKVQLNSAFGAMGNQYFRYYDLRIAEAITWSGKLSIKWIEQKLNRFLNKTCGTESHDYVIASDTDSVYLHLGPLVSKVVGDKPPRETVQFLNKSCNEIILPRISKWYGELSDTMNAYANRMSMKRENIAMRGLWAAKKRYCLAVHMGEDDVYMEEPDIKVTGLEVVRSSTPQVVRSSLHEANSLILTSDEGALRSFVDRFHDEFMSLSVHQISFPRGCNNLDEYADAAAIYKKSTPIAVKGGLLYNHLVKTKRLTKSYPLIREGDKIKFCYLKEPNPIREHVISFVTALPDEFGLEQYIDRETQFDKAFLEPLKKLLDIVGWSVEDKASLDTLFG
jgi:DNA polymerase elongation subunit (family B)